MALNFPNSPVDGQIYFDTSSGNRYIYDSANTIWKYAANNALAGSANSQILFNNEGAIDGSDALVFEANTLYPQEIVVTQNATATYYFGNGAFLTGISATGVSDLTPANNWANTLSTTDRAIANAAANSANAYTVTVGAASNTWANATFYTAANGAIAFTAANGAYINANNAANSANAYTVTVGAAANTFATSQDNNVRAFANSTANSANAYAVTVGAASNTWANATFYTAANGAIAFTQANGAYINANNAANSANAYTVTVGAAANTFATSQDNNVRAFANSTANSANAYAVTIGAASNTYANASFYTIANGAAAFAQANGAYINANNAANSANAYAVTVGAAANTWANATFYTAANGAIAYTQANGAYINANNAANSANAYTVTVGAASNTWANTKLTNGSVTLAGSLTTTGPLVITPVGGQEGGEIQLLGNTPNTNWTLDSYQNNYRIFAATGSSVSNVNFFHASTGSIRLGVNRSDPGYTLDVSGTVNAASYLVNGSPLSSGSMDYAYVNTTANGVNTSAYVFANGTANSANAYAVTVGAASNTWANATFYTAANGAIAFTQANGAYINANNAANSANAYAVTVGAAANTWANTKLANTTTTLAGTLTLTGSLTLVGNSSIFSNTLVTSVATSQILDSFATATWRSANYVVTMTAGTDYHTTQVSLVHDGTNAFITEYGTVSTANNLGLFDANIVSGTVRLNVIPTFAVTTINLIRTTNK